MKSLALIAMFLNAAAAFAGPAQPEAQPLQVQVNDAAFNGSVEAFFKERKTPIKLVNKINSDSYVQVSLILDHNQGTNCKVFVVASNQGIYVQYPASKSNAFIAKSHASHYCQKFMAESLTNALRMVF